MKKINIHISILSVALFLSIFSACKKDYFDINTNPNSPADATEKELLPSAQAAIALVVGNNFQIFGGLWGQYWTQSPSSSQYKTIEQYSPASNDFDRPWKALYADALQDLKAIKIKATAGNKPYYVGIAKVLEAYTYQLLTDNFGDVPFSEALKAESGILSPRYDAQARIYDGIFTLLDEAVIQLNATSDFHPETDDLIFGGDIDLWIKFANTLKLRAALRIAYVDPGKSQTKISELANSQALFLEEGEEVKINYSSTGGNSNPLYSSIVDLSGVQNLVASATAVNYLSNNNSPLIDAFYAPASNGSQIGIQQGAYQLPAGTPVSKPSSLVGGNYADPSSALAPVKIMTGYESLFLQSEAVARGWLAGDAIDLYERGITENFVSYGFINTDATTYYAQTDIAFPASGTLEQKIESIITQKWIAMCGNEGDEGWIEWRRTGYPSFFTISVNSIIGAGRLPQRFFYPSSEVTRNANFPGQPLIDQKVWWDVN